jgi:hypothetical protein
MKWRRTNLRRPDGSLDPDDWTRFAEDGRNLARIYKVEHGLKAGHWFWAVQVDKQGRSFNGGTGTEATGRGAKEACEARVPRVVA